MEGLGRNQSVFIKSLGASELCCVWDGRKRKKSVGQVKEPRKGTKDEKGLPK